MPKRLLAAVLAVLLLFCAGCSLLPLNPPEDTQDTPPTTPVTDYSAEYANNWCYRGLTPRLRQMYGAVYAAVKECDTDTHISIHNSDVTATDYIGLKVQLPIAMSGSEEARLLFNAFTVDNPQFFFVGNTYSYEGYRLDGVDYYDVFCLTLTMDAATRKTAYTSLEKAVTTLMATLPEGLSQYETERHLHDRFLAGVTYHQEAADSAAPATDYPTAFSAFGALVEGKAVCEGYSRAMQLLLRRAGIPGTLVSGVSEGEAHMWNLVEIDGRGYHLDPTWNDADDHLHHTYFNLTTEEILRSHIPDDSNLNVGTCTATEANYFVKEERYLDTYDRSLIAEAVAKQVNAGADRVELRFSPDTFANAQLFFSSSRRLNQYIAPFLAGESLWRYTCRYNDVYHTLTLYKEV